jgi:hypothetical protein
LSHFAGMNLLQHHFLTLIFTGYAGHSCDTNQFNKVQLKEHAEQQQTASSEAFVSTLTQIEYNKHSIESLKSKIAEKLTVSKLELEW